MRIAIVDDEPDIRESLSDLLAGAGHRCASFAEGQALITQLQRDTFDLIMLDWVMPGTTGIELIEWIGKTQTPAPAVVMLTNRSAKDDIASALNAGADDYIIKPEDGNVILARVEAILRRVSGSGDMQRVEVFEQYTFDRMTNCVSVDGKEVKLTSKEFSLALMFFRNQHRALSRAYILETLWKSSADLQTRTLDMHISRIRSKLSLTPKNGFRLQTIFGYGYRLEGFGKEE